MTYSTVIKNMVLNILPISVIASFQSILKTKQQTMQTVLNTFIVLLLMEFKEAKNFVM
jgi:hypothetical protein